MEEAEARRITDGLAADWSFLQRSPPDAGRMIRAIAAFFLNPDGRGVQEATGARPATGPPADPRPQARPAPRSPASAAGTDGADSDGQAPPSAASTGRSVIDWDPEPDAAQQQP
eukprot:5879050-Heterocapsa_arctica.AAC.1